jgi:hypothetical protein
MSVGDSAPRPAAEDEFSALIRALAGTGGVTLGPGKQRFGAGALQVDGRIFAMVTRGRIVMKLPEVRVAELIAAGRGLSFDAGKGRPMKEWVQLEPMNDDDLLALAHEARAFVANRQGDHRGDAREAERH